jgi:tRNA(Ile)-lysidine synthase
MFVRKFAENNSIVFYSKRFYTKEYAAKKGISIQMAARELRYTWFEDLMNEKGFSVTALAHNLNDNVETMLINLTRGTGIAGLTGMKPSTDRMIRPLLFATRNEIDTYCNKNKINYREDKSNAETKYTRNKIRHKVIPVLKDINPSVETTLNETALRMSGINDIVSLFINEIRQKLLREKDNITILNIKQLRPYLNNRTLIFELIKPFGITSTTLKDLFNIIDGDTGSRIYTISHMILKNRDELIISGLKKRQNEYYEIKNIVELRKVPFVLSAGYTRISHIDSIPDDQETACLDSSKLTFPLIIRKWQPGDYFYPLGMKQKKKLSDYFIDCKYSIIDKEKIFILETSGKIVWIIGDRIDNRFRITPLTKNALVIKVHVRC